MAEQKSLTIDAGFVDLVDELRVAQRDYFALMNGRMGRYSAQQQARLLERCKGLEKRVDDWIEQHKRETRAWYQQQGDYKTDELPGFYRA